MQKAAIFLGFVPWIVFSVVAGPSTWMWAALAAFLCSLILSVPSWRSTRSISVLDAAGLVFFGVLVVLALVLDSATLQPIEDRAQMLSSIVIAVVALGSLAVGRPFTEYYAKQQTPREYWNSPTFKQINRAITAVWGLVFVFNALCDAVVAYLGASSDVFNWVVPIVAIVAAVKFTELVPRPRHRPEPAAGRPRGVRPACPAGLRARTMTATVPGAPSPGAPPPVDAAHDPHLSGLFEPVIDEIDAGDLEVVGELPSEMDGMYLRNGPNPRFTPLGSVRVPARGRRHGARALGVGREGPVREPLRAHPDARRRDRRRPRAVGRPDDGLHAERRGGRPGARRGHEGPARHQRRAPRREAARARGVGAALRADPGARDARAGDLRRFAARGHLRPPEGRSAHRRDGGVLLRARGAVPHVVGARSRRQRAAHADGGARRRRPGDDPRHGAHRALRRARARPDVLRRGGGDARRLAPVLAARRRHADRADPP